MITGNPSSTALFQASTERNLNLNHARRNCPGCKISRSLGQFVAGSDYCAQCRRRGISTPKAPPAPSK
jgi:hypothetical protein